MLNKIKRRLHLEKLKNDPYDTFLSDEVLSQQRNVVFANPKRISIITPLFCTKKEFLIELIASVQAQTYADWELCLGDFSPAENTEVEAVCRASMKDDVRIVYQRFVDNKGIAANTNEVVGMASGEYLAILDHDDVLHPTALFEVMKRIETGADFIYTDEIKFEKSIAHAYMPNFKPDFAEEELKVHNYICHLNVFAKALFTEVGGYRVDFEGSQDHDLVLRMTEKAKCIVHIPQVLYYWRIHKQSVAANIDAKPYATISGIKAVDEAYARMGAPFDSYYVESVKDNIPVYRVKTNSIDDNGAENATHVLMITWGSERNGIDCEKLLNAVRDSQVEYIWLIHDAIQFRDMAKKLAALMAYIQLPKVGAVDAMLLQEDGTICSAGMMAVASDKSGMALNLKFRANGKSSNFVGYEAQFIHMRNVSAVSGLCTMYKKEALEEILSASVDKHVEMMRSQSDAIVSDQLLDETSSNEGVNADNLLRQLIRGSTMCSQKGMHLLWNGHVRATGDLQEVAKRYEANPVKVFFAESRDPFVSPKIFQYRLE